MAFFVAASADSHVETLLNKLEAKFKTKLRPSAIWTSRTSVTADDFAVRYRRMGFELGIDAQRRSAFPETALNACPSTTSRVCTTTRHDAAAAARTQTGAGARRVIGCGEARRGLQRESGSPRSAVPLHRPEPHGLPTSPSSPLPARCGIAASTNRPALCALDLTDNAGSRTPSSPRASQARASTAGTDHSRTHLPGPSLAGVAAQAPPLPREPARSSRPSSGRWAKARFFRFSVATRTLMSIKVCSVCARLDAMRNDTRRPRRRTHSVMLAMRLRWWGSDALATSPGATAAAKWSTPVVVVPAHYRVGLAAAVGDEAAAVGLLVIYQRTKSGRATRRIMDTRPRAPPVHQRVL